MQENDLKIKAEALLTSPTGKKLSEKKGEIEKIAESYDAKKVKKMLESSGGLEGGADKLKSAVLDIMKTQEGKRLAEKLSEILK